MRHNKKHNILQYYITIFSVNTIIFYKHYVNIKLITSLQEAYANIYFVCIFKFAIIY